MSRRQQWQPVLDAELRRWSAMTSEQLVAALPREYEVEFEGKTYQVEAELLENTGRYLHVAVSVDDGTLPASFRPLTASFIRDKQNPECCPA